jgi:EAL domain-containing protein (putative c-di-GMP-specific phosphodiesterase class I)
VVFFLLYFSLLFRSGTNYQRYQTSMNEDSLEQLALEADLRKAIPDNQLVLFYQPQIIAKTGKMMGVEALVRWQHPSRGLLGPDKFIPIAESTGLIAPLGEWLLNEACRQNKSWQQQGFPMISMAVNVSNCQFIQHDLLNVVRYGLKQTGLEPRYLELELTETSIMQAEDSAIDTLLAIKELGVRIAMDDFGTGFSSLNALRRFPIDCLKIDRCFIRSIVNNSDDIAIVSAIITMAKSLNMKIVAEGIEDKEQLKVLQQLSCDVIQGFLISKPVTSQDMISLLKSGYEFPGFKKEPKGFID